MPISPSNSGGSQGDRAPSDLADLARRAAKGDSVAFEALFRRLGPAVRRMLLGRVGGDEHHADDLSQRTWAGVWRSLKTGNYDPSRSAITTYIYAVGYRTWLHDQRQFKSTTGIVQSGFGSGLDEVEPASANPDPDAASDLATAIDAVRAALAGSEQDLADDERDLLRAIAAGESDRSIAKRLGLAASTINVRKQTALSKLRRILARKGIRTESPERTEPNRKQPL